MSLNPVGGMRSAKSTSFIIWISIFTGFLVMPLLTQAQSETAQGPSQCSEPLHSKYAIPEEPFPFDGFKSALEEHFRNRKLELGIWVGSESRKSRLFRVKDPATSHYNGLDGKSTSGSSGVNTYKKDVMEGSPSFRAANYSKAAINATADGGISNAPAPPTVAYAEPNLGSPLNEAVIQAALIDEWIADDWVRTTEIEFIRGEDGRIQSILEQFDEENNYLKYIINFHYTDRGYLDWVMFYALFLETEYPLNLTDFTYDEQGRLIGYSDLWYDLADNTQNDLTCFEFIHYEDRIEGQAILDGFDGSSNSDTVRITVREGTELVLTGYESFLASYGTQTVRSRYEWRDTYRTLNLFNEYFLQLTLWYNFLPRLSEYVDPMSKEWTPYEQVIVSDPGPLQGWERLSVDEQFWETSLQEWIPWFRALIHLDGQNGSYEPNHLELYEMYWAQPEMVERHFFTRIISPGTEPDVEWPTRIRLAQNIPNPFNPTTVIRFDLPEASQVTLSVYDILGERVATLVEGMLQSGSHSVAFNAAALPSGSYIYRLQTPTESVSRKMLLMK